jgi:RHS repeat-associated protein
VVIARYHPEGEYTVTGTKKYVYIPDQLGSVRDVIDATTGTAVAALDYGPYGNPIRTWGTVTPLYQYAGLAYHANSGLMLATYRALDGATGRWLNRDPIRERGGANLYGYVGGNPVSRVDPSGKVWWIPIYLCAANPVCAEAAIAGGLFVASFFVPQAGQMLEAMPAGGIATEVKGGVYALRNAEGAIMRTGRTCDLARREGEHMLDPALGHLKFTPIYRTDEYAEQRGLEQIVHDLYNPPLNKISPISPSNPHGQSYIDAGNDFINRLQPQ